MNYLPCETVETASTVDASVIWLHGLGADGHDFVPIVEALNLPDDLAIRFIFPHAPSIPVTINGGMVMPAWYDILDMTLERKINYDQIITSSNAIERLIEREISRGVDTKRIILAGFSQGGAVVYHTALTFNQPLGGLMTLSTYFPTYDQMTVNEQNKELPIHIYHGSNDSIVPEQLGKIAVDRLTALGFKPAYKTYPVDHGLHPQEIRDIALWIQNRLK